MNIHLAGIGWVDDCAPNGNRLRWSFPLGQLGPRGEVVGFPGSFVVERAPVHDDMGKPQIAVAPDGLAVGGSLLNYPISWWSPPVDLQLSDYFAIFCPPHPVQAVRFAYTGADTRVRVWDRANQHLLLDRPIHDQDHFEFAAPRIDEVSFVSLTPSILLVHVQTLDLFANRVLPWQQVATIHAAETFRRRASLDVVAARCGHPTSLQPAEWDQLIQLILDAGAAPTPAAPSVRIDMRKEGAAREYQPVSSWQTVEMALGLRWEFACLAGLGFFDGPRAASCPLDEIDMAALLNQRPPTAVAYRVRCDDPRIGASNPVVCPYYSPGALRAPGAPEYSEAVARLTPAGRIEATTKMTWVQHDFNALGAEIEEEATTSGGSTSSERFESQHADLLDPPFTGSLARRFEVPWFDVKLRARAMARDGWDRCSANSPWSAQTPLDLRHAPAAPTLVSAKYSAGAVALVLEHAARDVPAWQPDQIVKAARRAAVVFYRRDSASQLKTAQVQVTTLARADGDLGWKVHITPDAPGSFDPRDYEGGALVVAGMRLNLTALTSTEAFFELTSDGEAPDISGGKATIYQDMRDASLWTEMYDVPVRSLTARAEFAEPLPFPTAAADVLQYSCRVRFDGRLGPFGNIVTDFRVPTVPSPPPPFEVELQGADFYDRTMVKLTLTTPVGQDALLRVGWAPGDYATAASDRAVFSQKAVAGLNGPQKALEQKVLYDVLPLPLDTNTRLPISVVTIGVQCVNQSAGESEFMVVKVGAS